MHKLVLALALLAPAPAAAQEFDCLIQPSAIVTVVAADKGAISEVLVRRGDYVEAGKLVARLEDGVQRLQVDLTKEQAENDVDIRAAQTRMALRKKEYERARTLAKRSVASDSIVDDAEIELALTELSLEQAVIAQRLAELSHRQAEVFLQRRQVVSPTEGLVLEVGAQPGEYAHEQFVLMTIAEMDPLKVEAFLPQRHFADIETGQTLKVTQAEPLGGVFDARIATIDRVFDPASGTFGVVLEIDNPGGVIPAGTRCRLDLGLGN